jgi:uncharacterized protein YyaL (SSP411 family)
MAISAYLEASWTLGRQDLRDAAVNALDFLWTQLRDPESGSMYRYLAPEDEATPQVPGLLGDQAYTALALLDAHEVAGDSTHLDRALELARLMVHRFIDHKDGRPAGFFDTWDEPSDTGRLRDRQKQLQENAACAEVFLRLGHLFRNEEDLEIARGALESLTSYYPHMGYFAAGYAKRVDLFLNPPAEVNIVGDPDSARALHEAALTLDVPARIVQLLDPVRDAERLAALYLPAEPAPAAYACAGTMCSAPLTEPSALGSAVREMREAALGGVRKL